MYDVSNDGPEVYPEIRVNRMDNSVPRRQVDVELAFSVPISESKGGARMVHSVVTHNHNHWISLITQGRFSPPSSRTVRTDFSVHRLSVGRSYGV
jgi:hypothetical protein